jgi:hypothetical protein
VEKDGEKYPKTLGQDYVDGLMEAGVMGNSECMNKNTV